MAYKPKPCNTQKIADQQFNTPVKNPKPTQRTAPVYKDPGMNYGSPDKPVNNGIDSFKGIAI